MTHLLIEGICIGGLSSVISVDLAELLFAGLDPVVKKCVKLFPQPPKTPDSPPSLLYTATDHGDGRFPDGSQVSSVDAPPSTRILTQVETVQKAKDEIEKQQRIEKEAKLRKRNLWKRLVRVLILAGLAYLIITYMSRK